MQEYWKEFNKPSSSPLVGKVHPDVKVYQAAVHLARSFEPKLIALVAASKQEKEDVRQTSKRALEKLGYHG